MYVFCFCFLERCVCECVYVCAGVCDCVCVYDRPTGEGWIARRLTYLLRLLSGQPSLARSQPQPQTIHKHISPLLLLLSLHFSRSPFLILTLFSSSPSHSLPLSFPPPTIILPSSPPIHYPRFCFP